MHWHVTQWKSSQPITDLWEFDSLHANHYNGSNPSGRTNSLGGIMLEGLIKQFDAFALVHPTWATVLLILAVLGLMKAVLD